MAEPAAPPDSCWVITSREAPFVIKAASASWHALWKHPKEESIGKAVTLLQADGANAAAAKGLMTRFREDGSVATARCTNPTKHGELRSHDLLLMSHEAGLLGISTSIVSTEQPLSAQQQAEDAQIIPERPCDDFMQAVLRDVDGQLQAAMPPAGSMQEEWGQEPILRPAKESAASMALPLGPEGSAQLTRDRTAAEAFLMERHASVPPMPREEKEAPMEGPVSGQPPSCLASSLTADIIHHQRQFFLRQRAVVTQRPPALPRHRTLCTGDSPVAERWPLRGRRLPEVEQPTLTTAEVWAAAAEAGRARAAAEPCAHRAAIAAAAVAASLARLNAVSVASSDAPALEKKSGLLPSKQQHVRSFLSNQRCSLLTQRPPRLKPPSKRVSWGDEPPPPYAQGSTSSGSSPLASSSPPVSPPLSPPPCSFVPIDKATQLLGVVAGPPGKGGVNDRSSPTTDTTPVATTNSDTARSSHLEAMFRFTQQQSFKMTNQRPPPLEMRSMTTCC